MKNFSFIIPVYNEEKAIEKVIELLKLEASNSENINEFEIIIVDDNSTDKTFEILNKIKDIIIIKNLNNFGYGFSLKRGILNSNFENLVILDGDGTYPIKHLDKLLNEFAKGYDLVIGKRTGKNLNLSLFKKPMRILLKFIVEYATGTKIPDINSGFRIIKKKEIVNKLKYLSNTFSFTTSMTMSFIYSRNTVSYIDIPYDLREKGATSKVKIVQDSLRTLQYIIKIILKYDKIKLFVLLSAIQFFFSLFLYVISFYSPFYFTGATILFISAIITFCMGMLSETNNNE